MSRFFRAASDSESSYYSSDDEVQQTVEVKSNIMTALARFGKDAKGTGGSDDDKRVVRSAKEKFKDEIEQTFDRIDQCQDGDNISELTVQFDKLQKIVGKHLNTTIRDHGYPSAYTYGLVQLEKYLSSDKEVSDQKLKVALKAKVRKVNKALEEQLGDLEEYESEPEQVEEVEEEATKEDHAEEYTSATLYQKLAEVLESRGKKGTDKGDQLATLEKLYPVAADAVQKVKVLLALVSARFDFNQGISQYQSIEMWKQSKDEANQLMDILEQNPNMSLSETGVEWDEESLKENKEISIRGSLVSVVSRLDDELMKHLQSIDQQEVYNERLADEVVVYKLITRAEQYCVQRKETDNVSLLRLLRLEKLYFKYNSQALATLEPAMTEDQVQSLVNDLCSYLYKHAQDRTKLKVMLFQIYHDALHLRYEKARDLLLMSRLQDTIHNADINTQVLYNRALTQLGVCAFRSGYMSQCASALSEIMQSLKSKDLLAQGTLSKYLSAADDKREKQRVLPSDMHISLELLEAIQLTVSMLMEVPQVAANPIEAKRKQFSKPFRKMYEHYQNQVFTAPPENYKESIMQASVALSKGNWKLCRDLILEVSAWTSLPEVDALKSKLTDLIKTEALRTFLLSSGSIYSSISLSVLKDQFEMTSPAVINVVSRMIVKQELKASIDRSTQMLTIYHKYQTTKFQHMVMQYADKIALIVESTEKQAELKFEPKRLMELTIKKK